MTTELNSLILETFPESERLESVLDNPEQGLYTAVVAGFFISFLGGSRVQIGGPTAAFVVIIYGIIAQYGMAGLTVATLMAGLMLIIMGLLRFGDLIKFIPKTITLALPWGSPLGL